jgi:uncharacterized protein (DUF1800 family)
VARNGAVKFAELAVFQFVIRAIFGPFLRLAQRQVLAVSLVLLAGAAQAAGMGVDEARLLLNRTGFGATPQEIAEYARFSRTEAVERLLRGAHTLPQTFGPEWIDEYQRPGALRALSEEERKAARRVQFERALELRGWWLTEMLASSSPLTERMTLFWHNHFVSSQQKVKSPNLMYRQNLLLRRHALGNFGELLHAVSKDPAMIAYLDSATNRRGQPNENFAREVMELFTLGEGNYTEQDVREAARAFTGWSIEPETGEYRWRPFAHDDGPKTVLGRSGNFDGDAVLDILLAQPATAEFLVAKLWREFVSPQADAAEVRRIGARFRDSRYDIKVALRELLLAPGFWAAENRAALIKSPVDLVVGTLHALEIAIGDPLPFTLALRQLGQDLFAPPNVKGWPGGEAWINSSTLLARKQFLERLLRAEALPADSRGAPLPVTLADMNRPARLGMDGRERFMRAAAAVRLDRSAWFARLQTVPGTSAQRVLLAGAPARPEPSAMPEQELLRQLLLDPAYQLK